MGRVGRTRLPPCGRNQKRCLEEGSALVLTAEVLPGDGGFRKVYTHVQTPGLLENQMAQGQIRTLVPVNPGW